MRIESASEVVCKPSSVPTIEGRGRSSIYDGGCPTSLAADPRAKRRRPCRTYVRRLSYLALLRVELARFTRPTARLPERCRLVSVALVLASRRTGVTRYPASRSSDFPRISYGFRRWDTRPSDHLAGPPILGLVRHTRSTDDPIGEPRAERIPDPVLGEVADWPRQVVEIAPGELSRISGGMATGAWLGSCGKRKSEMDHRPEVVAGLVVRTADLTGRQNEPGLFLQLARGGQRGLLRRAGRDRRAGSN